MKRFLEYGILMILAAILVMRFYNYTKADEPKEDDPIVDVLPGEDEQPGEDSLIEVYAEDMVIEHIIGVSLNNIAHNVVVTENGQYYQGSDIEFISSSPDVANVDEANVNVVGEGTSTITVNYKGLPIKTFEVKVVNYHPIFTIEDFKAIGTNSNTMSYKYKLMNDIDFRGATVNSLSSYGSRNTLAFTGVFDGQGYTFSNMVLAKSLVPDSAADASLFGYINAKDAVIKNLNVSGAKLGSRGGVIATWVDNGTIENCFVDVEITGTADAIQYYNIGGIAWRAQAASNIKNCIVAVTIADGVDTTRVGAIVGMNLTNITNCQAIVLSENELSVYRDEHEIVKGSLTDSAVYTSVESFYANIDITKYSDIWVFDPNAQLLPFVGA